MIRHARERLDSQRLLLPDTLSIFHLIDFSPFFYLCHDSLVTSCIDWTPWPESDMFLNGALPVLTWTHTVVADWQREFLSSIDCTQHSSSVREGLLKVNSILVFPPPLCRRTRDSFLFDMLGRSDVCEMHVTFLKRYDYKSFTVSPPPIITVPEGIYYVTSGSIL